MWRERRDWQILGRQDFYRLERSEEGKGGRLGNGRNKDVNGRMLKGNDASKRWTDYFEFLFNVEEDRRQL